MKNKFYLTCCILGFLSVHAFSQSLHPLESLARSPDFQSKRISSYDHTGGNNDRLNINPGETKVLAEIKGPGAITHIWNTIAAERYYSRMLVLRMYWDGETAPSVEVPIGDFFGVGHGVDRPFQSIPVAVSSEGRARNCYWFMPFKTSAKITVTHEGFHPVRAFYYYIDYRVYDSQPDDLLYFHAQYRQVTPNPSLDSGGINRDGRANYLVMDTAGKGKYVGTVLSAQNNQNGWFGEGDDMFYIDGEEKPSLIGTGTEDYFNDAWGFREFSFPFHGVSLWEGSRIGARVTAYKWHIADPVAFTKSLRVTIEHGHANDRSDDWYSTAFWYQTLPPPAPPQMANVYDRLPDEGQRYAQRKFISRELFVHQQNNRQEQAVQRIDEYLTEDDAADEYGYWSLRKGILLKENGDLKQSLATLTTALTKSERKEDDIKAKEMDADKIHTLARSEIAALKSSKQAQIYVVAEWRDSYTIFLDGKQVASAGGGQFFRIHEVKLGGGKHVIAVKYQCKSLFGNIALILSHRKGYVTTDGTWKVSLNEEEDWSQRKFDDTKWKHARIIGRVGQDRWESTREPYSFLTPIFQPNVIWTNSSDEIKTVYFRKEFKI